VKYPPLSSHAGHRGVLVFPDGSRQHFAIADEITRQHTGVDTKIICLQLLHFELDGGEQIRVGYYVIGKKPKMRGRWVWGQFATMMPLEDFTWLIRQAEEKGWFHVASSDA
jgi:hypothetical protein